MNEIEKVRSLLRGFLKFNEPLAQYTSWHIGGQAGLYYRPFNQADLALFLKNIDKQPITWLGLGSNVLIHDKGIPGVVVHNLLIEPAEIERLEETKDTCLLRVDAGMTCAKLAKYCARTGLVGAEFLAGIPGTLGGALAMNAGAWGSDSWSKVRKVEVMDRGGQCFFRGPSEYEVGYRTVKMPAEEWFVAGFFEFKKGDPLEATQHIKALLQQRNQHQPIGVYSCGSVFKNPPHHSAGRLIEASHLKGFSIGDAEVSQKHANFILNKGKATAFDVLKLINHIQTVVFNDHQIELQTEVRLLGF